MVRPSAVSPRDDGGAGRVEPRAEGGAGGGSGAAEPVARPTELDPVIDTASLSIDHLERLATLGTIAGLIAHEFNNLLTPVVSYAQLALANPEDRELSTKALQRALSGSERAALIAHVILGFAREDAQGPSSSTWNGQRTMTIAPSAMAGSAPVHECVEGALACLARDPKQDGIALRVDIDPSLSAGIRPVALQHVLLNILLNARQAMLPAGGSLVIAAARVQEPGARPPRIELSITDTGRGMTSEQLSTLFSAFRTTCKQQAASQIIQTQTNHSGSRRGTGLGMTVCKRLVEEAGGYITVRSTVGQGTVVQIVLPEAGAEDACASDAA